jgi:hypothetical protein
VLDEPTLGLDLLFRRAFYDNLLNDYFDKERTILVTTHQVEEIENILTDVIFIQHGKIVLDSPMEALGERFGPAGARRRKRRARACTQTDRRARCVRPRRHAVRRPQPGRARSPRRSPYSVGGRSVRRDDAARKGARDLAEGGRMNTMLLLVRREFWEHRSLWIAPLVWAGIIILLSAWLFFVILPKHAPDGVLQATHVEEIEGLSDDRKELGQAIETGKAHEAANATVSFSFLGIALLISIFACIVVFFYLIDCLFSERRDRSILFWKSLPLSDTQTRPVETSGCAGRGSPRSTRAVPPSRSWCCFRSSGCGSTAHCLEMSWRTGISSDGFRPWSSNSPSCYAVSSGMHLSLPGS